ncbi:MAG TPA: hypothetical protein VH933_11980 [Aestuariivirgaceae bacterium]
MKRPICVGFASATMLALLCTAIAPGLSQPAEECGNLYPNTSFGPPPGPLAAADDRACYVEWFPDTSEQETDLLALCQALSGPRYLRFEHSGAHLAAVCVFKPLELGTDLFSRTLGKTDSLAFGRTSSEEDSLTLAQLPALVQGWTDLCIEKEAIGETDATTCWLDAAKAIQTYAAEVKSPLVNEINRLQMTWLRRAHDLLSISLPSEAAALLPPTPAPAIPELKMQVKPKAQVHLTTTQAKDSADSSSRTRPTKVKAQRKPADDVNVAPAPSQLVRAETAKEASIALPAPSQPRKKLKKRHNREQAALALKTSIERAKVETPSQLGKRPFLVKTSTTSKCFLSAEWC